MTSYVYLRDMKLKGLYHRWRHTRGFGVHSPFAFRIVTEAIHPARGYVYHAELLPGMTPLKRMAFRLRTLLVSDGYPELIYDPKEWRHSPDAPLFLAAPTPEQTDEILNLMRQRNCGLLLLSPRYIFAIARSEMAFVSYTML